MNTQVLCALVAITMSFGPMRMTMADALARGEEVYQRCAACHSLERNRTGPLHCHLLGRVAGAVPEFSYSPALGSSGIVWTRETLDTFLADPLGMVPGTRMTYAGVTDSQERADLIAYLEWASDSAPPCLDLE